MWLKIYSFRSTLTLILAPLILASIFLFVSPSKEVRCLYTVLVMAVYWVFEVVPLPVTALLPLILYPILGVSRAVDVAQSYMTYSVFSHV
uniref:Uncharacterized protein n=1 Tax=Romanomermis culicivorax TaxID=13658 RepID=A0A915J0D4_ROMCU